MNITLHIEHLVLHGSKLGPSQIALLQNVVTEELSQLLKNAGLGDAYQLGDAFFRVRTTDIQLASDAAPEPVGRRIARAIYRGIVQ